MSEQELLNKVQNLLDETYEEAFEAGSQRLKEVETIAKGEVPGHKMEQPLPKTSKAKTEGQKSEKVLLDLCNMIEKKLKNE